MNDRKKLVSSISNVLKSRLKDESEPALTYTELSDILNGMGFRTSKRSLDSYLGEVLVKSIEWGYPPITALVFNKTKKRPGDTYFTICHNSAEANRFKDLWNDDLKNVKEANWDNFIC